MLFAHLKRILKLDRLRLRGPNGARDPPRSNRPEPPKAGEADPGTRPKVGLSVDQLRQSTESSARRAIYCEPLSDFFNRIGQQQTFFD